MTHLSRPEFVDFIEGRLAPSRARHASDCAACGAEAESLREALALAHAGDVPEPSPLFWDHLSARIADAIDAGPQPDSRLALWLRSGRVRWAAAAVALVLAAGLSWRAVSPPHSATPPLELAMELPSAAAATDATSLDAWEALEVAAGDLELDDTETLGIRVRPGAVERLALELTAEEQSELMRLLEDEMKRNGA